MKRMNATLLPHLATRIFNTPLLLHPQKAETILSVLGPRIGLMERGNSPVAFDDEDFFEEPEEQGRSFDVEDGIACIPITGTLVKKSSGMNGLSGLTSYESLTEQIEDALTDPEVKGIIFDFDSPGGEVSGLSTLADFIYGQRGQKPMFAVSNDDCYSAAYWLASCADRIYCSVDGGVGSIGCYMMHTDRSKMNEMRGVKYTYIFAGDHKIDGNGNEPLNAAAEKMMQTEVDRCRDAFVAGVARNRGVSVKDVFDTQAQIYFAEAGIPLLADKIGSLRDAKADMAVLLGIVPTADTVIAANPEAPASPAASTPPAATVPPENAQEPLNVVGLALLVAEHLELLGARLPLGESTEPKETASHVAEYGPIAKTTRLGALVLETVAQSGIAHQGMQVPDSLFSLFLRMEAERGESWPSAVSRVALLPNSKASVTSGRKINMLVVPYDNTLSCNLGGFREVYQPGCFAKGLDNDPRAMFNHDEAHILGRKSAGTARFWEDAEGVHVECDAPETTWANDLIVSMERKDISQASAAFFILQYHWETRSGEKVRVIEKALLREASVHAFPAYETTQASVPPALAEAPPMHELELDGARLQLLKLR